VRVWRTAQEVGIYVAKLCHARRCDSKAAAAPAAGHRMLGRTREEPFPLAIGSIACASRRLESMCQ